MHFPFAWRLRLQLSLRPRKVPKSLTNSSPRRVQLSNCFPRSAEREAAKAPQVSELDDASKIEERVTR